jgi:antitoxin CptB
MSDPRLKRLSYRAWHRGTRELDLVLGRFADAALARMTEHELGAFENLLACADPDLQRWLLGGDEPTGGVDTILIGKIRESLSSFPGAARR